MKRNIALVLSIVVVAIGSSGCMSYRQNDVHSNGTNSSDTSRSWSVGLPVDVNINAGVYVDPAPVYVAPPVIYYGPPAPYRYYPAPRYYRSYRPAPSPWRR